MFNKSNLEQAINIWKGTIKSKKIDWQAVWNTRYLNESLKFSLLKDVMDLIEREVENQLR